MQHGHALDQPALICRIYLCLDKYLVSTVPKATHLKETKFLEINKQDRQRTHSVTLRRVRVSTVMRKNTKYYISECVWTRARVGEWVHVCAWMCCKLFHCHEILQYSTTCLLWHPTFYFRVKNCPPLAQFTLSEPIFKIHFNTKLPGILRQNNVNASAPDAEQ
jgi:hypothetical protein